MPQCLRKPEGRRRLKTGRGLPISTLYLIHGRLEADWEEIKIFNLNRRRVELDSTADDACRRGSSNEPHGIHSLPQQQHRANDCDSPRKRVNQGGPSELPGHDSH